MKELPQAGDVFRCEVCGYTVRVVKPCACADAADVIMECCACDMEKVEAT